jgi:hypothetical protein
LKIIATVIRAWIVWTAPPRRALGPPHRYRPRDRG